MRKSFLIFALFLTTPFIASSQDKSARVPIWELRKATEQIVEGRKYKVLDSLKSVELIGLDFQVGRLESIRSVQDSIIVYKDFIILNDSLFIVDLKTILKENKKRLRKQKNKTLITKIISSAAIMLALLI